MRTATHAVMDVPRGDWLLATAAVGRIACPTARGPVIFPVTFATQGRSVCIRTQPWSYGPKPASVVMVVDELAGQRLEPAG